MGIYQSKPSPLSWCLTSSPVLTHKASLPVSSRLLVGFSIHQHCVIFFRDSSARLSLLFISTHPTTYLPMKLSPPYPRLQTSYSLFSRSLTPSFVSFPTFYLSALLSHYLLPFLLLTRLGFSSGTEKVFIQKTGSHINNLAYLCRKLS